jgi:uncharacterized protein (TIGR02145 family)
MKHIRLFLSYVYLTVISVLLSGNLKAQTTITISSSITIDQPWVNANASNYQWIISGNNTTVTFGENLTITPTLTGGSVQNFFVITGTNVVINGANKIVTLVGNGSGGSTYFYGLVDASSAASSSAVIKNIGIENTGSFPIGASTGYISAYGNRAAIQNCYSTGLIAQSGMGGIVGSNNSGMISNCYSTGAISGSSAGGIVGSNNTVSGTIQNCYSTGAISGTSAGGIAGNSNDASIQNAYSTGLISAPATAGIANAGTGTISNTYIGNSTWNSTAANAALTGLGSVWNTTTLMPTINSYTLYDLILTSINLTSPLATLTSCLGIASSPTTFGVTGSGLTASVTISAPSNFEISISSGGTYSSSLTLTNTSTVSQTLYVRLSSSATAGAKTGNITATSTGVTDVTTTVSGTVNALPNIGISGTTTDVDLVSLTASGGSTYAWSDGTSTNTVSNTFDASGLYSLAVTDENGCISSTLFNITVQHWGLSRNGEKTLDSAIQINANGQIGSLTPLSQDGKRREYKQKSNTTSLPSITIGIQVWTNKNLDVTTYLNGEVIDQITNTTDWENATTGAWCYYNNDPAMGAIYGKLYNWYAVNDARGLAPAGWHIPTDAEWSTLDTYLGGDPVAGGKMKSIGTDRWDSPNTGATNSSGFNGLPGGKRNGIATFDSILSDGYWWSATPHVSPNAWYRILAFDNGNLDQFNTTMWYGFSVRLIRD